MPSLRAAFPLMLNDLTGVPGLCEKKPREQKSRIVSLKWPKTSYRILSPSVSAKGLFSLVQCVSQFASSDSSGGSNSNG